VKLLWCILDLTQHILVNEFIHYLCCRVPTFSDTTSFNSIPAGAFRASIYWFQVASGCLRSHNSNISAQHSLTFTALLALIMRSARSSFWSNNSKPTSYQLRAIDSLTSLKYFRAGWSQSVVVELNYIAATHYTAIIINSVVQNNGLCPW